MRTGPDNERSSRPPLRMPREPIPAETFLETLPLFAGLGAEELSRIAAAAAQLDAPRGTVLFRRGDACTGFHVILFGQVKLAIRGPDGTEKVVEVLGPRQSFGEAVMFLEKPYLVEAQALADSKLLFVPRAAVLQEIDADPRFALRLLAGMSARLHRMVGDIGRYALQSGRERVVGYLLSALGDESTPEASLTLATRKGIIASRLNLTQEHFSRILHELSAAGLIVVNGRRIRVPDVERLRAHAA